MKYIKNVQYEFATDLGPDFVFTPSACGFYLRYPHLERQCMHTASLSTLPSMRYHMLNKPYIAGRVQEVKAYALRVVLCHVDSTDDSAAAIREVRGICRALTRAQKTQAQSSCGRAPTHKTHLGASFSPPDPPQLSQQCLGLNVTLILAWSYKEVARYVETFKQYEGRPATMLQERVEESDKVRAV